MSTSRAGLRFFQSQRAAFQQRFNSAAFRARFQSRRFQSTDAAGQTQSTFQRMWNSPVGLKTVHFWAPVMKWAIVIAGISDLARPAEKLSLTQNGALMATGAIWTRWCLIIKPRNVLLATVNFFLGCVGLAQVTRIFMYRRSQAGSSEEALKELADEQKGAAESVATEVKSEAKKIVS